VLCRRPQHPLPQPVRQVSILPGHGGSAPTCCNIVIKSPGPQCASYPTCNPHRSAFWWQMLYMCNIGKHSHVCAHELAHVPFTALLSTGSESSSAVYGQAFNQLCVSVRYLYHCYCLPPYQQYNGQPGEVPERIITCTATLVLLVAVSNVKQAVITQPRVKYQNKYLNKYGISTCLL
jgi:hypothetical protein